MSRGKSAWGGDACKEQPGVLLAEQNWGNFLRLRTDCPIIANNSIMTPEDFTAIHETNRLLDMTPAELREQQPDVRYVLASALELNPNRLSQSLLEKTGHEGFVMLAEKRNSTGRPLIRGYRIIPLHRDREN